MEFELPVGGASAYPAKSGAIFRRSAIKSSVNADANACKKRFSFSKARRYTQDEK
jgi:hypothetical protein